MDKKDKKPAAEEDFELEEVVWAKVKGFSWWPAVVREIHRVENNAIGKKKEFTVYFLGEFSHARLQGTKLKNFESNAELVPKTNNKLLRDAIETAKKIIDHDTTYEKELEKFNAANNVKDSNKRKASEDLDDEPEETEEPEPAEDEPKAKADKKNKDKPVPEPEKKVTKKVKAETTKKPKKVEKETKPKKKRETKTTDKRSNKRSKAEVSSESSEDEDNDSEDNEIPTIARSTSFSIDPLIDSWSNKFDDIIKSFLSEESNSETHKDNFDLLEDIVKELRAAPTDFVSLLHTQLLKKMNFIAYILEKYFKNKKDLKILEQIKNAVDHYRNELIDNAFDISGLKSKHSDLLDTRND